MRFSIITICFNSEKTIERTIKSVLAQTCKDYEYIIVDGASKDGTLDIVKKYEPLFEGRMKWKSEPDTGIYNAMNKGIKRATGQIIGIVNSDDWLELDALEKVNESLASNNCDMNSLYCGGIYFHFTEGGVKQGLVNIKALQKNAWLYIVSGIRHPGLFVPQKIYDEVGLFNDKMRLSADLDFMLRCYYQGKRFIDIKAIVSNMSEGGISTDETKRSMQISQSDRKIMLKGFGKTGFSFLFLYYSWFFRVYFKSFVKKIGLYK